jgi:hypothetical protein
MGYGRYSHSAHVAMTRIRRAAPSTTRLLSQGAAHPLMNPKGVRLRESRDSEDNPNSLGVVFAVDVSESMGSIPERMARETLPRFMQALLDSRVENPQVMFMAVGQADSDRAPLQVGQFESTESLIDRWLTQLFLEGGGSGGRENYELAMYFAARHIEMDCVSLRGRRGFLFMTGDEPPNGAVSKLHVRRFIGEDIPEDIPIRDIIEEVQRGFEPFFLIPGERAARGTERAWRDLLGDRVVVMEHAEDTAYVAAGLVSLLEGGSTSLRGFVHRLMRSGVDERHAARIAKCLVPFAASIGRDDVPPPALGATSLPEGSGNSSLNR